MKPEAFEKWRKYFPQLARSVRGRPLTYLDSAATTLKPRSVVDAVQAYYSHDVANIHRSAHFLASQGTSAYEGVREKVTTFLGADHSEEIVFTKGTTEGLNLLASTLSESHLRPGDRVLLTEMEHHSNIVPWQLAAKRAQFEIDFVRVTSLGELDEEDISRKLDHKVKVFSFTAASNALGTVNPVAKLVQAARRVGAISVVDAAQAVALGIVDLQSWQPDFLVFSGHKLFGPTGVGVVYGRREIFQTLPPYQGGGSMIAEVTKAGSSFLGLPHRFEAGTPPIGEVIGLGAALDFFNGLNRSEIRKHESALVSLLRSKLSEMKNIELVGQSPTAANIVSFLMKGVHPSDVGQVLDQQGIEVRTGHHCCQPLMKALGISGTVRASFSIYTSLEHIEALVQGLKKAEELLT